MKVLPLLAAAAIVAAGAVSIKQLADRFEARFAAIEQENLQICHNLDQLNYAMQLYHSRF